MSAQTHESQNLELLAETYLRQWSHGHEGDWWAFEKVNLLVRKDPEAAWELTQILLHKADSDAALAYVAAGPLEDLLENHGPAVIERVEEESRKHARVRLALSGVWLSRGCAVWPRWMELMRRYGFADGSRRGL